MCTQQKTDDFVKDSRFYPAVIVSGDRPGWWPASGGGARLLWLCVVLPNATEAPVCYINTLLICQYVLFLQPSTIQSTKQESAAELSCLAEKIWQNIHVCNPNTQLCCSSFKCMFLTNVAPFKREINRFSNCTRFIAETHRYNREKNLPNTNFLTFCAMFRSFWSKLQGYSVKVLAVACDDDWNPPKNRFEKTQQKCLSPEIVTVKECLLFYMI